MRLDYSPQFNGVLPRGLVRLRFVAYPDFSDSLSEWAFPETGPSARVIGRWIVTTLALAPSGG